MPNGIPQRTKIWKPLYARYDQLRQALARGADALTQAKGTYIGSGIGSLDDAYDTSLAFEKHVMQNPIPSPFPKHMYYKIHSSYI